MQNSKNDFSSLDKKVLVAGYQALSLKAAADRLDWKTQPPRNNEPTAHFLKEYHLLLGLSFENLLKGYISLVRLERGETPSLPDSCYHHRLEGLAILQECAELKISKDEIAVLTRLSPYIEWAGRYPLPKKFSNMILVCSSSEPDEEKALWDRLFCMLNYRAWIMKGGPDSMGGKKLYMKRLTQNQRML